MAEKRLIDANDIDYENIMCSQDQLHWLNAIIEKQPTADAVEVVRCKDCKYYEHPEYYGGGTKDVCRTFKRQMKEDDYCSYGERKDNETV